MQERESNAMDALNTSISHIAENIDRYRKQPQHFTRKNKLPFDYYKEILGNYRGLLYELDIERIQDYAERFPKSKMISEALEREVF